MSKSFLHTYFSVFLIMMIIVSLANLLISLAFGFVAAKILTVLAALASFFISLTVRAFR